jgi:hypothetical protein
MLGFSTKILSHENEGYFSFWGNVIIFQLSALVHHFLFMFGENLG